MYFRPQESDVEKFRCRKLSLDFCWMSKDFCWMSKDFRWTAAVVRDQVLNLQGRHRGNDFLSSVFSFCNQFHSQIPQIHQPMQQTISGSNFCRTWRKKASHSLNAIDPSPFSSILANVFSLSSASWNKVVVMLTKKKNPKDKKTKRQIRSNLERGWQSEALLGGGCDRDHGRELSA